MKFGAGAKSWAAAAAEPNPERQIFGAGAKSGLIWRRRQILFFPHQKFGAGAEFHKGGGDVKGCMFNTGVGHSA